MNLAVEIIAFLPLSFRRGGRGERSGGLGAPLARSRRAGINSRAITWRPYRTQALVPGYSHYMESAPDAKTGTPGHTMSRRGHRPARTCLGVCAKGVRGAHGISSKGGRPRGPAPRIVSMSGTASSPGGDTYEPDSGPRCGRAPTNPGVRFECRGAPCGRPIEGGPRGPRPYNRFAPARPSPEGATHTRAGGRGRDPWERGLPGPQLCGRPARQAGCKPALPALE